MNSPKKAIFTTYVTFKISIRITRHAYRNRYNLIDHGQKTSLMYFLKTYKVCGRFDEFILNFSWMRGHKTKILFNKKFQDLLFTILLKEPKRSAATLCLNNVIPVSIAVPGFSSISSENPGSFWSLKPKQSL